MRVLAIGKYPPIEGGVAAHTYWLMRGLAEAGDTVSVVSNAGRVEDAYRVPLDVTAPEYLPAGVSVSALTEAPPRHIPYSEGFVTRLVNEGLRIVGESGADVIYAHYLEPYGVAGMLLKELTGVPLVVRHAGSDMHALLRHPEYAFVLARVLLRADVAIVAPSLNAFANAIGIEKSSRWWSPRSRHTAFAPRGHARAFSGLESGLPHVLYLGKAARRKGLLELIAACDNGPDFCLTLVTNGPLRKEIEARIAASERLKRRVQVLDFVPPWEVPVLLRGADLVVQLEHDFPVAIHTPSQPYEAIACARPLLLSREMAAKLTGYDEGLFTVVHDPGDVAELSRSLEHALTDDAGTRAQDAHSLYTQKNDWAGYVAAHQAMFASVTK